MLRGNRVCIAMFCMSTSFIVSCGGTDGESLDVEAWRASRERKQSLGLTLQELRWHLGIPLKQGRRSDAGV
jgi:hypothetical protein